MIYFKTLTPLGIMRMITDWKRHNDVIWFVFVFPALIVYSSILFPIVTSTGKKNNVFFFAQYTIYIDAEWIVLQSIYKSVSFFRINCESVDIFLNLSSSYQLYFVVILNL